MTQVIYHMDLAFTYIVFVRKPANLELLSLQVPEHIVVGLRAVS